MWGHECRKGGTKSRGSTNKGARRGNQASRTAEPLQGLWVSASTPAARPHVTGRPYSSVSLHMYRVTKYR